MSQQTQSVIRAFLMAIGAFLIGHHVFTTTIDASLWDTFTGIALAAVTLVWGVLQKTTGQDQIIAFVKQLAVFVGGFLVAAGKLSADQLNTWLGIVTAILSTVLSIWYKSKSPTP